MAWQVMNIRFKDKSNTPNRTRFKPISHASVTSKLSFNNHKERPLNYNSQNLSFKGLSVVYNDVEKTLTKYGEDFGDAAKDFLREQLKNANKVKNSAIEYDKDKNTLKITEKPFWKRFIDVCLYPIKEMPLDIANSIFSGLKQIPLFENSKVINNILDSRALKTRRESLESISTAAAYKSYSELLEKGESTFIAGHKRFKPDTGNYNSTTERTLTRIVTGMIPAFFLANDAYNLSIFLNNNKDMAKEDKKRRFRQETARVALTAFSTMFAFSLFSKKINSSATINLAVMGALTLTSEIIGRWLAGTPVKLLNEKTATDYKRKSINKPNEDNTKTQPEFSGKDKKTEKSSKTPEKGKLTFKNILKIAGVLMLAGFGVEKISNINSVKKILTNLNKKYKSLYTKDCIIEKSKYKEIIDKLKENNFDNIIKKYEEVIDEIQESGNLSIKEKELLKNELKRIPKKELTKEQIENLIKKIKSTNNSEEVYYLGSTKDKIKYVIIHQILSFPVRFAWDFLMFPYKNMAKPLIGLIKTQKTNNSEKVKEKVKKEFDISSLAKSMEFFKKIKDKPDFKERVNKNLLSSFDSDTKSNYSAADISAKIKMLCNVITSAFLIIDNYNMVMIDSKGKDKELAEQKAKERTIQRTAKIIYGNFIIKLFNGVFANLYNASLLGAQFVNTANALTSETLERSSVGLPLGESDRDTIIESERQKLDAKGLKGDYFRAMAKLTGKKRLEETKNENIK